MYDAIVIGAGLSGLVAAYHLADGGLRVLLIAKGIGRTHIGTGCVDVLSFLNGDPVASPAEKLDAFLERYPDHPYALVSRTEMAEALEAFKGLCAGRGWPYFGELTRNWMLPTAAGVIRPTCLAPESMTVGDMAEWRSMLIVGFHPLRDFFPEYAAANLARQTGREVRGVYLDLPDLSARPEVTPLELARWFDRPQFLEAVIRAVRPHVRDVDRVAFPAALGLSDQGPWRALCEELGRPVCEIPTLPPSVPGIRLFEAWRGALLQAGGRVLLGFPVVDAEMEGRVVRSVSVRSAVRPVQYTARFFVLATGGIYGHGLETSPSGAVEEPILRLPVRHVPDVDAWAGDRPNAEHAIYRAGVAVDSSFRPVDDDGRVIYDNVYVVGSLLAGGVGPRFGTLDGVAVTTGYAAAKRILSAG